MQIDERSALKSVLAAILLGQTIGGLNGLAAPRQTKRISKDVEKVNKYAEEVLRQNNL